MTEQHDELTSRLLAEHERATPEVWPHVRHRVEAMRTARALLAALEGPPSPRGRLRLEMLLRRQTTRLRKAV